MTMPYERTRSVVHAGEFLRELVGDPALPEAVRIQAQRLLRHYASAADIWRAGTVEERLWALLGPLAEEGALTPELRRLLINEPLFCGPHPGTGKEA